MVFLNAAKTSLALEKATHETLNENIVLGKYAGCFPLDNYLRQDDLA
jgi:hypothetical protein